MMPAIFLLFRLYRFLLPLYDNASHMNMLCILSNIVNSLTTPIRAYMRKNLRYIDKIFDSAYTRLILFVNN